MKKLLILSLFGVAVCELTNGQNITANYSFNNTVCVNTASCFIDLSTSNNGPITSWLWLFGDATSTCCNTPNPCHYYAYPGTYIVTLIITNNNGDKDTVDHPITVNPSPIVTCSANPDTISSSASTVLNSSASGGTPVYIYSWSPNTVACNTCPNTIATPTISTCYTILITDVNGCSDTCRACVIVDNTLNIREQETINSFTFYPNPNNGIMQLNYTLKNEQKGVFVIYDLLGKKQVEYELQENTISISINETALRNGMYFYKIVVGDKIIKSEKIIILKESKN
ncbi:MAG: PKD domain-containing protein [Bacteroidota bacterium]